MTRKSQRFARLALAFSLGLATHAAAEPPAGLVVLAVPAQDGSEAPAASGDLVPRLQVGDELLAWRRAGAPGGPLSSPEQLAEVEAEQAPLGPVALVGRRRGVPMVWAMPQRPWRLRARPSSLAGDAWRLFRQATTAFSKDPDGAARTWLAAVAVEDRAGADARALWLLGELGRAWAEAARWPEADATFEDALRRSSGAAKAALWRAWGETFLWRHNWERAEHCYREAMAETRPGSLQEARDLAQLAAIAANRGDLAAMEDFFRQSLSLRSRLAPQSVYLIQLVREEAAELGSRRGSGGDPAELDRYLKQLRAIRDRLLREAAALAPPRPLPGSPASPAPPDRPEVRIAVLRRLLSLSENEHPGTLESADRWRELGRVGFEVGFPGDAEPALLHALDTYERLAPGTFREAGTLYDLAILHRAAERTGPAGSFFCRAAASLARFGRLPESEGEAEILGATPGEIARDCMAVLLADGRAEEAFLVLERHRVRSTVPPLPAQLARRLQSVESSRADLLDHLAGLSTSRDRDEIDRLVGELAGLDARRDELAGPLSLEALRAALAPGSLLLTWSVDEGAERLFLLHPAGAPGAGFQSFPVSPSLRDNLAVFSRAGLYQRLLGPAEAALATAEHLVLVPCHELRTVPFADLLRGETRLGEQKRIETAVSANAWARR